MFAILGDVDENGTMVAKATVVDAPARAAPAHVTKAKTPPVDVAREFARDNCFFFLTGKCEGKCGKDHTGMSMKISGLIKKPQDSFGLPRYSDIAKLIWNHKQQNCEHPDCCHDHLYEHMEEKNLGVKDITVRICGFQTNAEDVRRPNMGVFILISRFGATCS